MAEIEALLKKGSNPVHPNPGFNNSTISDSTLVPIIQGTRSNLEHQKEETKLADGVTVLRHTFSGAKYTETEVASLEVEVRIV